MNEITRLDESFDPDTSEVQTVEMRLPALDRAEIDMQIATARAYPRSLKQVASAIYSLVTLDEESAAECTYALPRGGKPITGPSIRFAEALKQAYGNCRDAARVTEINRVEKYVEAEGVFFDLQTNAATAVRVRRRISGRDGKVFSDDMILVTGNAACSIAKRNAILGGIPKPLWRAAYDAATRVISGDVTTLAVNREKALKAFGAFGVKPEQIFAALGIKGVEDVTVDHIVILRGMHSALKNGESTVEEMFSPPTVEKKLDAENNPLVDKPTSSMPEKQSTKAKATVATPAAKDAPAEPAKAKEAKPENQPKPDLDEAAKHGERAALAGDDRDPGDLEGQERAAWLTAYDKATAEAEKS